VYTNDDIQILNQIGMLSASYLSRKHQITIDVALDILNAIVADYENVFFFTEHQICIEGRQPEYKLQGEKKIKPKSKKISKWKDITKP
jgi:hypothetical protein